MRIAAIVFNIFLCVFTCFIVGSEGAPRDAIYAIFTLLLVLIPVLNVPVLLRCGASDLPPRPSTNEKAMEVQANIPGVSSWGNALRIAAIAWNLVLLGFASWAILDQYPHPEEDGVLVFTLLVVLTPILTAVVLFRSGPGNKPDEFLRKKGR